MINPNRYTLAYKNIIIKETKWDFKTWDDIVPYKFVRRNRIERRNALWTLKIYDLGLPDSLKREMILFI